MDIKCKDCHLFPFCADCNVEDKKEGEAEDMVFFGGSKNAGKTYIVNLFKKQQECMRELEKFVIMASKHDWYINTSEDCHELKHEAERLLDKWKIKTK
jgi:hypothetical protein